MSSEAREQYFAQRQAAIIAAGFLLCFAGTPMAHGESAGDEKQVPEAVADCAIVMPDRSPNIAKNPDPNHHGFPAPDGFVMAYGPVFVVRAASAERARRICTMTERQYARLLDDFGLPRTGNREGRYPVTIYSGNDEYQRKADQPGSGGCTVGNAVYTYEHRRLEKTLAHELTHLILMKLWAYRGFPWLNEGLAQVAGERADGFRWTELRRSGLRLLMTAGVQPRIEQITAFKPLELESNDSMIWHDQVASLAEYMLAKGGKERMRSFIELLARWSAPVAFNIAMGDIWKDMPDLERDWKEYLWQADHLDPASSPEQSRL